MSQEPLNFGRLYTVEDEHRRAWRATEDAIAAVGGLLVAAGAAGMRDDDLNKTFVPNSGRHLRLRTVMGIGAIARLDTRRAIITPIARALGFNVQVANPMDDKEARIRCEEALKSLGPIGEAKLAEIYGDRR